MKFGLLESDFKAMNEIFSSFPQIKQVVLYGSRAKGNYKRGSDVDITLKGNDIDNALTRKVSYLLNEETFMPYKFDLINYKIITSKELLDHIDRVGKVIYNTEMVESIN